MGRKRFIWMYGVLGWGVSVAIPWSLVMWYFESPRGAYWPLLLLALVAFPVAGYVYGSMAWRRNEQVYAAARVS